MISDGEGETPTTCGGRGRSLTVRLMVRSVRTPDQKRASVRRHHPFVTNFELPTAEADITHRRHAIIDTTFADLIDGPLAHIPSRLFAANSAWLGCAVIAHNLLRAAGTLAGGNHAAARGATLRRDLVNVPARFAAPARKPMLHLPARWPGKPDGKPCGTTSSAPTTRPPNPAPPDPTDQPGPPRHPRPDPRNLATRKSWYGPADHACATAPHPAADQGTTSTTTRNHPSTDSG